MGLFNYSPTSTKKRDFGSSSKSSRACSEFLLHIDPNEAKAPSATVTNSGAKDMHKVPRRFIPSRFLMNIPVKEEECKKCIGTSKRTSSMMYRNKENEGVMNRRPRVLSKPFKPISTRMRVEEALSLFRELLSKRMRELKAKPDIKNGATRAAYTAAAIDLRWERKWVNTDKRLGAVPGVEVGDKFQCATELNIVGLHRQFQGGIDYMIKDRTKLATSIVASGRYANDMISSEVFIYSGQGGNPSVGRSEPKDQKLERGNLALKNSMEARTPVRVIRGFEISNSKASKTIIYVYDGLYLVEKFTQERGAFGKLVFKFVLRRIPGQPKINGESVIKIKEFCK